MGVSPPYAAAHRAKASSVRRPTARTMSLPVIAGLVRVADFVLLGAIGLGLANGFGPTVIHAAGGVTLAASLLAAIGASFALARNGTYTLPILTAAATGIRLALMPVGLGVGCLIAAFFFQGRAACRTGFSRSPGAGQQCFCSPCEWWGWTG